MSPDPHVDPTTMGVFALGEPVAADAAAHVAGCPSCSADLAALRHVVAVGRATDPDDALPAPPARVWSAIEAEIAAPVSAAPVSTAPVTTLRPARHWSTALLVAASVTCLVLGGLLGIVLAGRSSTSPPVASGPTVVATTDLTALPHHAGSGQAKIEQTPQGPVLVVDVADLSRDGRGFYEVWLIDPDTMQMVGLGALDGADGRFAVPKGLDLSTYRVVDVSLEPMDGNPLHSGDSIVRGTLTL
jgi:anti-sigma-K factor RskA